MNGADKAIKLRSTYGERNPKAKMTEAKIDIFDRLRSQGLYYYQLAERFGISECQAERIGRRVSWRHLAVPR
jgi:hypothetical protein